MQYRRLKRTGDELSILGFGCMRLPQKYGRIDEKRATRQIRSAIDGGVNYLDTAMPYHRGASESFLGRVLADGYRQRVKLATKLPPWLVRVRPDMDRLLDLQRHKLRTEQVDYYLVHSLSGTSWERMRGLGVREFLDQARRQGRIVNVGFSFHGDRFAFKRIVDDHDWDFCLIQYNFLDQEAQAGSAGLECAAAKGLGVMVMEPLRGGLLGGRVPAAVQTVWDRAPGKRSPAEWALRWVWNRPEVSLLLSGMNDEAHIAENLRIANDARPNSLSDEELRLIDQVADTYRKLMRAGCTGCGYCLPCPAGVNIPACLEVLNDYYVFDNKRGAFLRYLARAAGLASPESAGLASLCTGCGQCEEKCPQHLPIQKHLEEVVRTLEGRLFRVASLVARPALQIQRWRNTRAGRLR
jgi:predicted aldo/keto reductase-like oxidoreductase